MKHTCVVSSGAREEENRGENLNGVLQTDEELLEGLVLLFSPAERRDAMFLGVHHSWSDISRRLKTYEIKL